MGSLFNISNDLMLIFDELEQNGGELTPELKEQLELTEDNFRSKISNYVQAIKFLENDIDSCKKEKDRINSYAKSKTCNKERLSKALIDAIMQFGENTKTGGKFIDLQTCKVAVRQSEVTELNEILINTIIDCFFKYAKWFYDNNQLGIQNIDKNDLIIAINEMIKDNPETSYLLLTNKRDEEDNPIYKTITIDDISSIKVNLFTSIPFIDLTNMNASSLIQGHIDFDWLSTHKSDTDKTSVKNLIKNGYTLNIADIKTNLNLNIK